MPAAFQLISLNRHTQRERAGVSEKALTLMAGVKNLFPQNGVQFEFEESNMKIIQDKL